MELMDEQRKILEPILPVAPVPEDDLPFSHAPCSTAAKDDARRVRQTWSYAGVPLTTQPHGEGRFRATQGLNHYPDRVSISTGDLRNRVEIQFLFEVRKQAGLHQVRDDPEWLLVQDGGHFLAPRHADVNGVPLQQSLSQHSSHSPRPEPRDAPAGAPR